MVKILLSGGGTLGSVAPLLAIRSVFKDADYLFVGTRGGLEESFVRSHTMRFEHIWSAKWRRYRSMLNIIDPFKFPVACIQALRIVRRYRPNLILTCGGYVSVPVAIAGWLTNTPVFMHQQDLKVGLANKIIQHFARVITVTFEHQRGLFPEKTVFVTGNPVRPHLYEPIVDKPMLLIIGGSLGARGLNAELAKIVPTLTDSMHVVHILGQKNYYQRLSLEKNYTAIKFLTDDYFNYVNKASVVISRSGMSAITELASLQKCVILIPMPNSHQQVNARYFADRGAAIVIQQDQLQHTADMIKNLMTDTKRRVALGHNLHGLFPGDAAENYKQLILQYLPNQTAEAKKTAFFIGIGGIGVSALVRRFMQQHYSIAGSDLTQSHITQKLALLGAHIHYGHNKNNVPRDTSIVLFSDAVPQSNEELIEARRRHLQTISYYDYLGELSRAHRTIAITGTHGKTTTTAMTGLLLTKAALDPTIVVGSLIPQLEDSNYRHGQSNLLVVEADEYRGHMLTISPTVIIMTNLEVDHLDYFHDLNDIIENFTQFAMKLPDNGVLIKNCDDKNLTHIRAPRTVTFGFGSTADCRATKVRYDREEQIFDVAYQSQSLGLFRLQIPGSFNVSNALAAICAGIELGCDVSTIKSSLAQYRGSWRRLEVVGTYRSCTVYSDYAHHPTAVRATLKALRELHTFKRILLVYQPHSLNRSESLLSDFSSSFTDADMLILTNIYDVAGRDIARLFTGEMFYSAIRHPRKTYAATATIARECLNQCVTSDTIIVIMGAGDIDGLARSLVQCHENQK